jgi:hypothetical protein
MSHTVKCPHPECEGVMKISDRASAGVHDCKCGACKVRLTWNFYLDRGNVPALRLAEKEEGK